MRRRILAMKTSPLRVLLFLLVVIVAASTAYPQSYVPIIANGTVSTDLWLYNPTTSAIAQKVGHLRFTHPGTDDIIVEPTVTLAAGEWRWIRHVEINFDRDYRQIPGCYDSPGAKCALDGVSSDPGFYVWQIDSHLRSKVVVDYPGVTSFAVASVSRGISTATDSLVYRMVGVDFQYVKDGVNYPARGAFPTFLNLGGPIGVSLSVCQSPNSNSCTEQRTTIGAGIRQVPLQGVCPNGCTVTMYFCRGACGAIPPREAPLLMILANGPNDGRQQEIIYGE